MLKSDKKVTIGGGEAVPDIEEIRSIFSTVFTERRHAVLIALGAILVIAAAGIGVSVYRSSQSEKAQAIEAEALAALESAADPAKKDPGGYTKALTLFQEAASRSPSPVSLFFIGEAQLKEGKTDEARKAFEAFTKEFSSTPLGVMGEIKLAAIEASAGKNAEAISRLEKLFKDPVAGDTALLMASRVQEKMGQQDKSKETLKKLVADFPDSPWAKQEKDKEKASAASSSAAPAATVTATPATAAPSPAAPADTPATAPATPAEANK